MLTFLKAESNWKRNRYGDDQVKVNFDGAYFVCSCTFEERHLPRQAGFLFSTHKKKWYTSQHAIAARLRSFADKEALKQINAVLLSNEPWTGAIPYPAGLTPFEFQLEAARFALSRNRSYLALDMGLGKGVIAALIANALKLDPAYICPPFLVENVRNEFRKWAPDCLPVIMKDSILHRESGTGYLAENLGAAHPGKLLIIDEAHRFKSDTAKRTQAIFGIAKRFERVVFMSGTPMPNRPIELYPVLSNAAPETIEHRNKFQYGKRYCAAFHNGHGWDFSGASNMKELAANVIGPFMMRIRKTEVLKQLPPKTEEMVIVDERLPATAARLDAALLKDFSPEDLMGHLAPNGHVATYRRELGIAKAKHAVKFIRDLLDETDESVLVFGVHKEAIIQLRLGLHDYNPLYITGDTPMRDRQPRVDEFQTNPARRLFIGNIQAAGTGFTLTKATRVVFAEFSWTPADNDQASDRAHRIGQHDNVFVQYLVFKNSIDRAVLETVLRKRKITAHI